MYTVPAPPPPPSIQPHSRVRLPNQEFGNTLAEVDNAVGEIYAALEDKGLADNTLFLLSSDNGWVQQQKGPGAKRMHTPSLRLHRRSFFSIAGLPTSGASPARRLEVQGPL